jgi:peroxiredoxin
MRKVTLLIAIMGMSLSALAQLTPGDPAPEFKLKNVDGEHVSLNDYSDQKGAIVIFTCNGCPVAKAYEQRIIELDEKYASKGYPVIAINPNDPAKAPVDSYENMQLRAQEKGYTFPYLFDEDQSVYPAYGATKTPHTFLLTKTKKGFEVAYIGAIDDNQKASKVEEKYLEDAIAAVTKGKKVKPSTTRAVGCSIKAK